MSEKRGSVVTDDGVRLTYKVYGEGPRNLLLMHGWGGSANSWNGLCAGRSAGSNRCKSDAMKE
jgi:pimeloyl-ACP methyl ester carboxylesterase